MEKPRIVPSTEKYDELNNVGDAVGKYKKYLHIIARSKSDLMHEYEVVRNEFLENPSIYNVQRKLAADEVVREYGLGVGYSFDGQGLERE